MVIAGPAYSGKSELLGEVREHLRQHGVDVRDLQGSYGGRSVPYSTVAPIEQGGTAVEPEETHAEDPGDAPEGDPEDGPPEDPEALTETQAPGVENDSLVSPYEFVPAEPTGGSRRRGGARPLGMAAFLPPTRPRSAAALDSATFWQELVDAFHGSRDRPVAVLVEDASLADAESRDFLLDLTDRARTRPLLIVLVLDLSLPMYGSWEERLIGRGDVDWVRHSRSRVDPREEARLREGFEALPELTRRILGYVALMGGSVSEVGLGRVTRMTWRQLADALLPATEANLVKLQEGKLLIASESAAELFPQLLPAEWRDDMHREIAEALAALSPEPDLRRRLELAQHYFAWDRGPVAMRYLLETAELTEKLSAFDDAEECLAKAILCVPSLPEADRREAEAELRLFRARILFFSGRPTEAEQELREGMTAALGSSVTHERLEEWVEALVPSLRAMGPRPSLVIGLVELADRAHDAGAIEAETLLQTVIAEHEAERNRPKKARDEANRAARLARQIGRGPVQALALMAVGISRLEGTAEERDQAHSYLKTAQIILGASRRYLLQQHADEVALRLMALNGQRALALRGHERSIPVAQRLNAPLVELYHHLGVVGLLLDEPATPRIEAELHRVRELTELLHLLPPAPGLLRLWLLEGRYAAATKSEEVARDRWRSIVDLPGLGTPPRIRSEAMLRLAILELTQGNDARARELLDRLKEKEARAGLRPEWIEWLPTLVKDAETGTRPSEMPGAPAASLPENRSQ